MPYPPGRGITVNTFSAIVKKNFAMFTEGSYFSNSEKLFRNSVEAFTPMNLKIIKVKN
jgi:hypothetical protein